MIDLVSPIDDSHFMYERGMRYEIRLSRCSSQQYYAMVDVLCDVIGDDNRVTLVTRYAKSFQRSYMRPFANGKMWAAAPISSMRLSAYDDTYSPPLSQRHQLSELISAGYTHLIYVGGELYSTDCQIDELNILLRIAG